MSTEQSYDKVFIFPVTQRDWVGSTQNLSKYKMG